MNRALVLITALALCAVAQAKAPAKAPAKSAEAPPATRQLEILQRVMPDFSTIPVQDGGCVTVKFVIKHDGFVGDITVLDAKPAAMAEPTVAALKQWMFQSFPPPDLVAVQTFQFTPEQVRLPDTAIRSPYLEIGGDGALKSAACGAGPVSNPGKAGKPGAKG